MTTSKTVSNTTSQYAGRQNFNDFRRIITVLVLLFRLLPISACEALWSLSVLSRGRLGVLLRYCIAKKLARSCGDCVYFGNNVSIRYWDRLHIGSNVSIHTNSWIDAYGFVTIGNSVAIAHNTSLISTNHEWNDESVPIKENPCSANPIVIDDDVWIGCGCRILAGVRIGGRSVIGAGAVVTNSIPAHSLALGIPAKVVRTI
jgi:acetyltransferase-like isoleucine patch superfamily enzyme